MKPKTQQQLDDEAGIHNTTGYDSNTGARLAGGTVDLYGKYETDPYAGGQSSAVPTFTSTPGVISSKDDAVEFKSNGTKLDEVLQGLNGAVSDEQVAALEKLGYREGDTVPGYGRLLPDGSFDKSGTGEDKTVTGIEKPLEDQKTETGSGDPVYDKMEAWKKEAEAKFDAESATRKAAYESMYRTTLASIDATAAATIQSLNSTYDQRINEQKRINQLRIDRVKAYGLGGDNAMVDPIGFTDAVTLREEEAASKIQGLENERMSLIAQAKAARDSGSSKLLRERLEDLGKIDDQIRTQLTAVKEEANKQYELLKGIRKDEETKHKEALAKMVERVKALAPKFVDDFNGSVEEQDALIAQIQKETGLDYPTIYGILRGAQTTQKTAEAKGKKDALDLDAIEALIRQRKASANASEALARQRDRDKGDGEGSFSDTEKRKLEQKGIAEAPRQQQLDYLYGDPDEYEKKYKDAKGSDGTVRERAEAGGYDYDAMKAAGHSDEDIAAALDEEE